MNTKSKEDEGHFTQVGTGGKQPYSPPMLTCFGDVRSLTASGSADNMEGNTSDPNVCSSQGENAFKGPCAMS